MKFFYILVFFFFLSISLNAQYPSEVEKTLKQSGKNRKELEKVILYFQKQKDPLKIKATYFLISNMDIHYSANYFWADSHNHPVVFNELAYPSFEIALNAFTALRKRIPGIHPIAVKYRDLDSIKGDFLIDNIEKAFALWEKPWAKNLSFDDFCEFLLPYRISVEPLQNWRTVYEQRFSKLLYGKSKGPAIEAVNILNSNLKSWFVNTYSIETRNEPLPLLGPLQLLFRKQGPCEDMAGLGIYTLRSQGLPCAVDFVNYWATSSGKHVWNVTMDEKLKVLPFDPAQNNPQTFKIQREPSKVFRVTYSKQPSTLASQIPLNEIPGETLKSKNIKDVTSMYWKVTDLDCMLFPSVNGSKVAYACVFNSGDWRASYWGWIKQSKTVFSQMGCGAIYLPMIYLKGKLKPAGYPVAVANTGSRKILIPDTLHRHSVVLPEQDKYLIYRPGKKYRLMYWDNNWKFLGVETAGEFTRQLSFNRVPQNTLLLLIPEYSEGKERPFTINEKGERQWW